MPYTLSTDYATLYALLLQGEEVACWVDAIKWPGAASTRELCTAIRGEEYEIYIGRYGSVRNFHIPFGTEYDLFLSECRRLSLSFIPQHDVAKIAESACKQLLQAIADGFRQNVAKADTISDMAVFQAIADTIANFPIPKPVTPL